MKFMLLIHQGPALEEQAKLPPEEQQQVGAAYHAVTSTPGVTAGQWMRPPEEAKTITLRGGKPFVTDGPFAETKEALGGYLFYECESFEQALELAERIPAVQYGGAVEVRPLN